MAAKEPNTVAGLLDHRENMHNTNRAMATISTFIEHPPRGPVRDLV